MTLCFHICRIYVISQIFQLADLNRLGVYFSDEYVCDGKLLSGGRSAVACTNGSVYIYQIPHS